MNIFDQVNCVYLVSDAKVILIHRIIATFARLAESSREEKSIINEYIDASPLGGLRHRQTAKWLNITAKLSTATSLQ